MMELLFAVASAIIGTSIGVLIVSFLLVFFYNPFQSRKIMKEIINDLENNEYSIERHPTGEETYYTTYEFERYYIFESTRYRGNIAVFSNESDKHAFDKICVPIMKKRFDGLLGKILNKYSAYYRVCVLVETVVALEKL